MLSFSTPSSHRTTSTSTYSSASTSASSLFFGQQASSPLANSSPERGLSSPVAAAQARRRGQYKSRVSSASHQRDDPDSSPVRSRFFSDNKRRTSASGGAGLDAAQTHSQLLKGRFEAQCLARVKKARAKKVDAARTRSDDLSSDGEADVDMEGDGDGDDETWDDLANDEIFTRVMLAQERKRQYSYRVSYDQEVGSSWDPAMEAEFAVYDHQLESVPENAQEEEDPPVEFDEEEEIAQYARDLELARELRELESLDNLSEILALSDDEDEHPSGSSQRTLVGSQPASTAPEGDVDMDIS